MKHVKGFLGLIGLFLILSLGGCESKEDSIVGGPNYPVFDCALIEGQSLRSLADARGLIVGSWDELAEGQPLSKDAVYQSIIASEFNAIMLNIGMIDFEGENGQWAYLYVDEVLDFAEQNGMKVFAQHLVWHESVANWVRNEVTTAAAAKTALKNFIDDFLTRYKGRIYAYSVVNEAVDPLVTDQWRNNFWYQTIGPEYIALAFQWARAADPDAKLYYNDFNCESAIGDVNHNQKAETCYTLVKGLVDTSVPIDAMGFQMHTDLVGSIFRAPPDMTGFSQNLDRYAALGLELYITEMDVATSSGTGTPAENFADQAVIYKNVMDTALSKAQFKAFVTFGFTDKYSWVYSHLASYGINVSYPEEGPLLFDPNFNPKPAYCEIRTSLATN